MEAVFLPDQSISAYNGSRKHMSLGNYGFVYGHNIPGNFIHGSNLDLNGHGSLFGVPPSLSSSFSSHMPSSLSSSFSSLSSFSSSRSRSQKQPPLLPLPSVKIQALPSPQAATNKKNNKGTKDQAQEPKKAKSVPFKVKKESRGSTTKAKDRLMGPDPKDLPTKGSRAIMTSSSMKVSSGEEFDEFSGSIFSISPPPSSLPLPKFSLRPKGKCNAEAGGVVVDTGASDDLRRLLHLQ